MRVLALSGSPRQGGNTETLLAQAIAGARQAGAKVEPVRLAELCIAPCQECNTCHQTGECHLADDMQALYPKLRGYERLMLASPVFFGGLSAQAKAMVDRCQACWVEKYRLPGYLVPRPQDRQGIFISTCGYDRLSMFDGALATVRALFCALDVALVEALLHPGMDSPQAAAQRPAALAQAYQAGWRLGGGGASSPQGEAA